MPWQVHETYRKITRIGRGKRTPTHWRWPLLDFGASCLNATYIKINFDIGSRTCLKIFSPSPCGRGLGGGKCIIAEFSNDTIHPIKGEGVQFLR